MDTTTFPSFEEFLLKTARHAEIAGFRFRGLQDFPEELHAFLSDFAAKLRSAGSEDPLRRDLMRALGVCEKEAIRKVMVVTCKELDLFPPKTDETSDIAGIAFALYAQHQSLEEDPVISARYKQLNMTAFFIADFAHFAGIPEAAETSPSGRKTLNEFLEKAKEKKPKSSWKRAVLDVIDEFFPASVKKDVTDFFDSHSDVLALGAAFAAGVAIAALFLGKRK